LQDVDNLFFIGYNTYI